MTNKNLEQTPARGERGIALVFVLLMMAMLISAAIWLTRDTSALHVYELAGRVNVTGLQPQADGALHDRFPSHEVQLELTLLLVTVGKVKGLGRPCHIEQQHPGW